jgi:nicotinamide mononucleotide transporter
MWTKLFFEILASFLGLGYTILIAKKKRSGWILGSLSCGMLAVICFQKPWLPQGIIQTINAFFGVYAFLSWGKSKIEVHSKPVYFWGLICMAPMLVGASFLFLPTYPWSQHLDHCALGLSLVGTWLTLRVIRENWYFWLVINAMTTLTAFYNGLYFFATLSLIYFLLSIYGLIQWKK